MQPLAVETAGDASDFLLDSPAPAIVETREVRNPRSFASKMEKRENTHRKWRDKWIGVS
jgi:hypothetical protein